MVFIGMAIGNSNYLVNRVVEIMATVKSYQNTYYMLVTNDKYELPQSPPMRSQELAEILGKPRQYIYNCVKMLKDGKNKHIAKASKPYCIVKVVLEND